MLVADPVLHEFDREFIKNGCVANIYATVEVKVERRRPNSNGKYA